MRRVTRTERLFFWPRCFCHGRRTLTDCWLPVASGFYTSTWRVLVARGHSQSENSPPTNQLWISSRLLALYFWMECAHLPLPLGPFQFPYNCFYYYLLHGEPRESQVN